MQTNETVIVRSNLDNQKYHVVVVDEENSILELLLSSVSFEDAVVFLNKHTPIEQG